MVYRERSEISGEGGGLDPMVCAEKEVLLMVLLEAQASPSDIGLLRTRCS